MQKEKKTDSSCFTYGLKYVSSSDLGSDSSELLSSSK